MNAIKIEIELNSHPMPKSGSRCDGCVLVNMPSICNDTSCRGVVYGYKGHKIMK